MIQKEEGNKLVKVINELCDGFNTSIKEWAALDHKLECIREDIENYAGDPGVSRFVSEFEETFQEMLAWQVDTDHCAALLTDMGFTVESEEDVATIQRLLNSIVVPLLDGEVGPVLVIGRRVNGGSNK